MPAPLHRVVPRQDRQKGGAGVFDGHERGLTRTTLLDRAAGSVHVGYAICELAAGGTIDRAIHAFEKTIYLLSGALEIERDGALFALTKDDFAMISTGVPHALRNISGTPMGRGRDTATEADQRLAGHVLCRDARLGRLGAGATGRRSAPQAHRPLRRPDAGGRLYARRSAGLLYQVFR